MNAQESSAGARINGERQVKTIAYQTPLIADIAPPLLNPDCFCAEQSNVAAHDSQSARRSGGTRSYQRAFSGRDSVNSRRSGGVANRLFRLMIAIVMGASSPTLWAAPTAGSPAGSAAKVAPRIPELIVLFKESVPDFPATAEDIFAAITTTSRSALGRSLAARLGDPASIRYLIGRRAGPVARARLARDSGADRMQRYVVLTFLTESQTDLALKRLASDRAVLSVERNFYVGFSASPSDPYYPTVSNVMDYQWGLHSLNMAAAWDLERGNAYIGHVDHGIQVSHPDLQFAYRPQFIFDASGASTPSVDEIPIFSLYRGHGSHTAGIIAASTSYAGAQTGFPNQSPALGVAGMCWYCSLMVARASDSSGQATTDAFINSINWATDSGAQIINMSFGIEPTNPNYLTCSSNPGSAWCTALSVAAGRDVVLTAAAGNGQNTTLDFPAVDSRTIAVGATQSDPGIRGFLWTEEAPQGSFSGVKHWTGHGHARDIGTGSRCPVDGIHRS